MEKEESGGKRNSGGTGFVKGAGWETSVLEEG